jgi:hypothetical protein
MAHRVTETVVQERSLKVNTDGVLEGGKLLGNKSLNNREYSDPVIAEGIGNYDGAKVYLNHPRGRDGALERDFNDWVGVVESPRARKGGGFGNVRFRKEHARFKEICEAIENFPTHFGFSHVADIDSEMRGGVEHVTKIGEVFSVDLVTDPASTQGVFESKAHTMKKTFKQIVESSKGLKGKKTDGGVFRAVMEEAMATGEMPATAEVEVPETASDDEAVKAGLKKMIVDKLETADAAAMKSVLKALGVGDSISELLGGAAPETNTSAPLADETAKPEEVKKMEARMARMEAENMLHKAGREATEAQIIAVASVPEANKKAVVEGFPAKAAGATRESRRPDTSPPANSSANETPIKAIEERVARKVKEAREKLAARK